MSPITVTGTLVNPAEGALAGASVAFTLVDYNDRPLAGFDPTAMTETVDTAAATPDPVTGDWSIALTPNSGLQLFDDAAETAYRVVESSAGASSTYWIVVAGTSPAWVGSLRTAAVSPGQPTALPGTWCALTDVPTYTGRTDVVQADVNVAQVLLEAHIHRVWRSTDASTRDYYWLTRAAAFQALYVHCHPELLAMMDVQSMSQDGVQITFRSGTQTLPVIGPATQKILNNLFRASNNSVRLNSAFQKNRLVRAGVGSGGSSAWSPM